MPDIGPLSPNRNPGGPTATISMPTNIDPQIVTKLQRIVTAINNTTAAFGKGSSGITDMNGQMKGAISALSSQASGQMITAFTTGFGPATVSDGNKASTALTSANIHLNTVATTINEQLPAIQTGMAAYTSALNYEQAPSTLTTATASTLQTQINTMMNALGLIAAALPPANSGIGGLTIGGACATGIQPGGPRPNYNGTLLMTTSKDGGTGEVSVVEGEGGSGGKGGTGGESPGGTGGEGEPPEAIPWFKVKGKALNTFLEKLPVPAQKAIAVLIGGSSNSFATAMTTSLTSGATLSTFITNALGSLVGSYVVQGMAAAGIVSSTGTIVGLSLAGGLAMGSITVWIIKPLVLDKIFPTHTPATPPPTIIIRVNNQTGEKTTVITQSNGSSETIDVKPDGTEIITQTNADGTTSTSTIPAKK